MATSGRNLVSGSGNVTTVSSSNVLTFANAQDFKAGATVKVGSQLLTIDSGAEKIWNAVQPASSSTTTTFTRSDTTTARTKGSGEIVPNAQHYLYRSPVDASGAADWYFYFDTLAPENGVHPYTKDQYAGASWVGAKAQPILVPNLGIRVRVLEGILRGSTGDIADPDKRLDAIEARLAALETWANSAGHFGTPPAVGGTNAYTLDQLQSYGDLA